MTDPIDERLSSIQQSLRIAARLVDVLHENVSGVRKDLGYLGIVTRVRAAVRQTLSATDRVTVVSRGDDLLTDLGCDASHFPQSTRGVYAGHHPEDSAAAIAHLQELRAGGVQYLIVPATAYWWFEHYTQFAGHLNRHRWVWHDEACVIVDLDPAAGPPPGEIDRELPRQADAGTGESHLSSPDTLAVRHSLPGDRRGPGGAFQRGKTRPGTRVQRIIEKLWGGFSSNAIADLGQIAANASSSRADRVEAAWELARWHAVREDFERTLSDLGTVASVNPLARLHKRCLLLEGRAMLGLGTRDQIDHLIRLGFDIYGEDDPDICLLASNAGIVAEGPGDARSRADRRRLDLINRIFSKSGLLPLRLVDPDAGLRLDNISASRPDRLIEGGPTISVIVPAYNSSGTIASAIRSLREQTWGNIEIVVVDDASTDDTWAVVQALAAGDRRIRSRRLEENSGTYVARNVGLGLATGEFVTVHDADDWSHPEKLEIQLKDLLDKGVVAITSEWVRTSPGLRFLGNWRQSSYRDENISSLMLRTSVAREMGGWDPVRFGADNEFKSRLESRFGNRIERALAGTPLAFALDDTSSLTRNQATHISTLYYGMRQEYRRAYQYWHRREAESPRPLVHPAAHGERAFPVPAKVVEQVRSRADTVVIADFREGSRHLSLALNDVGNALKANRRVAVFHWPEYSLHVRNRLAEPLESLIHELRVTLITWDEAIAAECLSIVGAELVEAPPDALPEISFERLQLVSPGGTEWVVLGEAAARAPDLRSALGLLRVRDEPETDPQGR